MADFRPFKAWRYDSSALDLKDLIAPPYDVISTAEQEALYRRSEKNCVRLILNREETTDTPENNRYTRARAHFCEWQSQGTLKQDPTPSFYLYRQIFKDTDTGATRERLALLGLIKLEPFDKNIVVPHEKTLAKPKQDRRKLLETTQVNFSPIFGLYEDPQKEISAVFQSMVHERPAFDVLDGQSVRHTVWLIGDAGQTEKIHAALQKKSIYIADGHHRYQTALDYSRDMRVQKGAKEGVEIPSDFTLMAIVEFHDPGLVLMPTHRLVKKFSGFSPEKMLESLKAYFDLEPMPLEKLSKFLKSEDTQNSNATYFGVCLAGGKPMLPAQASAPELGVPAAAGQSYAAKLRSLDIVKAKMPGGKPDFWYALDVNLLNYLIFDHLLGLNEAAREATLGYTHSDEEALGRLKAREVEAVFLLAPPRVEILRQMGGIRELLPQKSTYFYPKLASGTVFYSHNL